MLMIHNVSLDAPLVHSHTMRTQETVQVYL